MGELGLADYQREAGLLGFESGEVAEFVGLLVFELSGFG